MVAAEDRRIARFDLLANAVLSLVRAMVLGLEDREQLPDWLSEQIASLAGSLRKLAATPQPWPPELARDVAAIAWHAVPRPSAHPCRPRADGRSDRPRHRPRPCRGGRARALISGLARQTCANGSG